MERQIKFNKNLLILRKKEFSFFVRIEVQIEVENNLFTLIKTDLSNLTDKSIKKNYLNFEVDFEINDSIHEIESRIDSIKNLWKIFKEEEKLFNSSFASLKKIIGSAFDSL